MRIVLAGLTFCVAMGFVVAGVEKLQLPEKVGYACLVLVFFPLLFLVGWLFNPREKLPPEVPVEALEAQGLVETQEFAARRAFEVEEAEAEDEGRHLFIELKDGRLLHLCGQYLYDFAWGESDEDDGEIWQQGFPSTRFVVKRHKTQGYVLSLVPLGSPIEVEEVLPAPTHFERLTFEWPSDGALLLTPFDEIARQLRVPG